MRTNKTYRVEDIVGDAADADTDETKAEEKKTRAVVSAARQMCLERPKYRSNSAKRIEDLNGDEIMDLRVISDELSASANRVVWDCSNENGQS